MNEPFISCSFVHASTWGNDRVQIGQRGSIVHNLKPALTRSAAADGKGRGGGFGGRQVGGGRRCDAPRRSDDGCGERCRARRSTMRRNLGEPTAPQLGADTLTAPPPKAEKAAPTIWSQPPCQRICLGESTLSPCRDLVVQEHSPRGAPRCRQGSPAKRPTPRAGPPEPRRRNRSPRGPRHQGPPRRRQPTGQPAPGPRPQRHPRPRQNPHPSS